MPWEGLDIEQWAKERGVNLEELREKEKLIKQIVEARKKLSLTQSELAQKIGVSQSRISQIESRIKVDKLSFDILISILRKLGYKVSINAKKSANSVFGDLAA